MELNSIAFPQEWPNKSRRQHHSTNTFISASLTWKPNSKWTQFLFLSPSSIWPTFSIKQNEVVETIDLTITVSGFIVLTTSIAMNISASPIPPIQPTNSDREVSKSAFEFLLAEILLQPAYLAQSSSEEKSDTHLHLLDLLGYDVGFRYAIAIELYHATCKRWTSLKSNLVWHWILIFLFSYAEKILVHHKIGSTEPLNLMIFICKEFWEEVFKKKVTSLRPFL